MEEIQIHFDRHLDALFRCTHVKNVCTEARREIHDKKPQTYTRDFVSLFYYEGLFQTDSTGNSGAAGVQVQLE